MCYPCSRKFLPRNHIFRKKTNTVYQKDRPFFPSAEITEPPRHMTPDEYLKSADKTRDNPPRDDPVNGVKRAWPLRVLPYHNHIAREVQLFKTCFLSAH